MMDLFGNGPDGRMVAPVADGDPRTPSTHEMDSLAPAFRMAWYGRLWVSWLLIIVSAALLLYGVFYQKYPVFRRPAQSPATAELKSMLSTSGPDFVGLATYHGLERRPDGRLISVDVMEPTPPPKVVSKDAGKKEASQKAAKSGAAAKTEKKLCPT